MTDYAGVFAILFVGAAAASALVWAHARLAGTPSEPPPAEGPGVVEAPAPRDPRSGPSTRIAIGFLPAALWALIAGAGLAVLLLWALAARGLGMAALVSFSLLVAPSALGLLHAASRSPEEW